MSKPVTLIIEDGDLACWRPINNTFDSAHRPDEWSPMRDYWNGLLIELGDYKEFKGDPKELRRVFASVQLKDAGGRSLTYLRDFSWINIVAERTRKPDNGTSPVQGGIPNELRTRGGENFDVFARITYWQDWGGYDLSVREQYLGGRLSLSYVFTFPEVKQVFVIPKGGGEPDAIPLEKVSTITVNGIRRGRGPGGGINDPPPREP